MHACFVHRCIFSHSGSNSHALAGLHVLAAHGCIPLRMLLCTVMTFATKSGDPHDCRSVGQSMFLQIAGRYYRGKRRLDVEMGGSYAKQKVTTGHFLIYCLIFSLEIASVSCKVFNIYF